VPDYIQDEEEFTTGFTGRPCCGCSEVKRYWPRVMPFLHRCVVAVGTAFHVLKQTDQSTRISWPATPEARPIALVFRPHAGPSGGVYTLIILAASWRRVQYDFRKEDVQPSPGSSPSPTTTDRGGLDAWRASPQDSGRIWPGSFTWGLNDVFWALTSIASHGLHVPRYDWDWDPDIPPPSRGARGVGGAVQEQDLWPKYRRCGGLKLEDPRVVNEHNQGVRGREGSAREERNLGEFSAPHRRHAGSGVPRGMAVRRSCPWCRSSRRFRRRHFWVGASRCNGD